MQPSEAAEHLSKLDALLTELQWLWRPMPYKEGTPSWVARAPQLAQAIRGLDQNEFERLTQDASAALSWLGQFEPGCHQLNALCLPQTTRHANALDEASTLQWEVPGRKWQQIHAFCEAIDRIEHPILDWCGGKGHLGRYAAQRWQQPVTTLEFEAALCQEGERLAQRASSDQRFHVLDVLSPASEAFLANRHVLALHACGDLHRELVRRAASSGMAAMDIAPCCYHLGKDEIYQPFNNDLRLRLTREDRRIAVTESVTAPARERTLREKEAVWKLAFDEWQQDVYKQGYHHVRPIPKAWLKLPFGEFLHQLAQREAMQSPLHIDFAHYEKRGESRYFAFVRYNIVRLAFRRAIESWLVMDMVEYLRCSGYAVAANVFCERGVTPRNVAISAVRIAIVNDSHGIDHHVR